MKVQIGTGPEFYILLQVSNFHGTNQYKDFWRYLGLPRKNHDYTHVNSNLVSQYSPLGFKSNQTNRAFISEYIYGFGTVSIKDITAYGWNIRAEWIREWELTYVQLKKSTHFHHYLHITIFCFTMMYIQDFIYYLHTDVNPSRNNDAILCIQVYSMRIYSIHHLTGAEASLPTDCSLCTPLTPARQPHWARQCAAPRSRPRPCHSCYATHALTIRLGWWAR